MSIEILTEAVASQIAAGEVVERPASVVKELLENAIDAGARTIRIEIRGGGRELIQVADDGQGIPAAEFELAFTRHATSKLRQAADLEAIETLGFRGEALAAIAAVSRVTAVSRAAGESAGTRLTIAGAEVTGRETVGAPQGTVIAVANLFYNVPARLKFLKTVSTERRVIDETVTRYALAYPDISFRLSHDNRITLQTSGSGRRLDVLAAIYGPDTARELLPIGGEKPEWDQPRSGDGVQVSGYVGPPSLNYANRTHITLFVNGRWVKDNQLTYAVIQAYHTLLPSKRYPLAVVFIDLPPEQVDVNVHPTKTEVRFRRGGVPFGIVQRAVRQTLVSATPIPQADHFSSLTTPGWAGRAERPAFSPAQDREQAPTLGLDWSAAADTGGADESHGQLPLDRGDDEARLPIMRVVGQVGAAYIVTEGPDGLFLIDQHAAHERILYERFMAAWEAEGQQAGMAAQSLMEGAVVHLTPAQARLLEERLDLLGQIGFEVEAFGPNAYKVRSIPALLTRLDPARALLEVVEDLEGEKTPLQDRLEARLILRVCKSAAVKAGQTLSQREMEALVRQLEQTTSPHTCPHGRPTMIHLSVGQLAREFGRI
ncbi:MAG: DNA mismatch repair endonuclease MutL [Candidatus Promineifilaceae bacterium]|nr:DNA mismatch repair endonuclease MutL [Candidatus Promineifilaceae bacterium]